ncbi:hypothetical protein PHMEG_00012893 [Phytophthora megakarya]|uniref:B box-type domain-containing protein n=1 Tax=Phytophthora megakarya TaxID=4795 RepID=A0A225W7K9_9STRA|nr:hypothetical protein PHMEG_00012893 [Phytophthora megakarya]
MEKNDKDREQILAVKPRGRRNGLIAPLSLDPTRRKLPTCDNCQQRRARKRCPSCDQVLCDKCHARLHELANKRYHAYREFEPRYDLKAVFQTNQKSFQCAVLRSSNCVAETRTLLLGDNSIPTTNVSVEKHQRKTRVAKEKLISQMQINIPVAMAKHAAQVGEETIFSEPAELELAALYTTQKKYERARELLRQVEKLITDSLGILHPAILKVAIAKAQIAQVETSCFEQSANTMQDALSLFEGILPLDHKDILAATSMLLQSLDAQKKYHQGVIVCRQIYSLRLRALPPSHKCLTEICEHLDEFISKREKVLMSREDFISMEKIEQERKRLDELANECEKHLANFRHLILKDPDGLSIFLTFARQEFAEDLVTFWIAIEEFKQDESDYKTLRYRAIGAYLTYIKSRRIKVITAAQRKKIKKAITNPGKKYRQQFLTRCRHKSSSWSTRVCMFDTLHKPSQLRSCNAGVAHVRYC